MDNSIIIGIFVPVQVLKIRGRSRERSGPPRFYYGSVCFIDKSFPLALNNLRAKVYSQLAVSTTEEKPRAYSPDIYSDIYCGVKTESWEYTLARKLFRAKGNDLSIKQTEP